MYGNDTEFTNESLMEAIIDTLVSNPDSSEIDWDKVWINTFDEAGVLSYDTGFCIRTPDGSEFQVTIKQSR